MNKNLLLVPLLAQLMLVGCSSLSKQDCLEADWFDVGVRDGSRGFPVERLGSHDKACAKISVQPDEETYFKGREKGLLSYCTAETGLSEGKRNNRYHDVCPTESEKAFLTSYIDGLELRLIDLELESLEYRLWLSHLRIKHTTQQRKPDRTLLSRISSQENLLRSNISERRSIRRRIANHRLKLD
jgi:hypothetical protein